MRCLSSRAAAPRWRPLITGCATTPSPQARPWRSPDVVDHPPPELQALDRRVFEVPQLPESPADRLAAETRGRMLPALAAAHSTGSTSVSCWMRAKPGGPMSVLVGGAL